MRNNTPVTGIEVPLPDDTMIVSRTNLKGIIEYVNRDFIEISGFSQAELIGSPHNLVRHPDMPEAAFADFWRTLKSGRPWTGLVKNRCKNGDHYWVEANATPLRENGKVVGYMSVRSRPTREQVAAAEAAYRRIRESGNSGLEIREGRVVRDSLPALLFHALRGSSLRSQAVVSSVVVAGMIVAMTAWLARGGRPMTVAAAGAALTLVISFLQHQRLLGALRELNQHVRDISEGRFRNRIESRGAREVSALLDSVRTLQIKLGFDLAEARRATEDAMRIKVGLDNVATNVMIADRDLNIIYLNRSIREMLDSAQKDIQRDLPDFDASRLIGTNIDVFHRDPAHQRGMLASLRQPHRAEVRLGGRIFALTVVPVTDDQGHRLGTAVEWVDRTAEAAVEKQVNDIVRAAARGDFSERLSLDDKTGFFRALALGINQVLETSAAGLGETARVLKLLSSGDLSADMQGNFEGTFAQLQQDLNHTAAQWRRMVGDIQAVVEHIRSSAQEVSQGNLDLSRRTEQQAAHLEETAASAEELTSTVRGNAEHSQQAQRIVQETRELANDSGGIVREFVSTMREIDNGSGKIAEIVSLIDGIAFQTNILALNAAVEAARAGEQGRGFAVVAAEVRSLAQKCASAARDVKTLIDESTRAVAAGTAKVDQANARIDAVINAIAKVENLTSEISASSREQAAGVDQVARTVSDLDENTQRNAALVEQTAAAAASMEEQAGRLSAMVAVFRLDCGSAPSQSGSTVSPIRSAPDDGESAGNRRRFPRDPGRTAPGQAQAGGF